jgi:hypothetical protein
MNPVGHIELFDGNLTTLNWIGPRPPSALATNLGLAPYRFAAGYWVVLLRDKLIPDDFQFAGTTLLSGGRLGLPARSAPADQLRRRMHDQILEERGPAGYRALQEHELKSVAFSGPFRLAKVVTAIRNNDLVAPDLQYPQGGGALQWQLINKKNFLIALHVAANGMATTPRFSVSLAETQPPQQLYSNRHRIHQYLVTA